MAGQTKRLRQPSDVRRRLIVDSARGVIAERGLAGSKMRDIATAAEISLGTLTYHFSGVDDLLAEILRVETAEVYMPIMEQAHAQATGAESLEFIINSFLASTPRMREHWVLWLNFWTVPNEQHGQWQRGVYRDWHRDLESLIERGVQDGSLRSDDPAADALAFVAQLDGLVVQAYMPPGLLSAKAARVALKRSVRHLLARDAAARPPPPGRAPLAGRESGRQRSRARPRAAAAPG